VESAAGGLAPAVTIHQGLDTDAAREVVKLIKKPRSGSGAGQDDQVRVTGKKRDELRK
jgi:uncharacterized protein YajQ (UPF0234 family)